MATPFNPPSVLNMPDNPADYNELHVPGYARLAYFFAQYPQYTHLRRFSNLSARILLHHQHKLIVLEEKLLKLDHHHYSNRVEDSASYHSDLALLTVGTDEQLEESNELRQTLENVKCELKEYEEALIRFNELGRKGWDPAKLKHVQRWLADKRGIGALLSGVDANVWGTLDNALNPALDIVQVIKQPEKSFIEDFLQDKFLLWTDNMPEWLHILLFWTKKHPDQFNQYIHSTRWFENAALLIGNIGTSALVYGAVTSLYLGTGKVSNIVTIISITFVITICGITFKNQHFVTMVATVCAVLVTLIANSGDCGSRST